MTPVAASDAAAETPSTPGSASGFRNRPWSAAPDAPSAAPAVNAAAARGRRISQTTMRVARRRAAKERGQHPVDAERRRAEQARGGKRSQPGGGQRREEQAVTHHAGRVSERVRVGRERIRCGGCGPRFLLASPSEAVRGVAGPVSWLAGFAYSPRLPALTGQWPSCGFRTCSQLRGQRRFHTELPVHPATTVWTAAYATPAGPSRTTGPGGKRLDGVGEEPGAAGGGRAIDGDRRPGRDALRGHRVPERRPGVPVVGGAERGHGVDVGRLVREALERDRAPAAPVVEVVDSAAAIRSSTKVPEPDDTPAGVR